LNYENLFWRLKMEGACGRIERVVAGRVRKVLKRTRRLGMDAFAQAALQERVRRVAERLPLIRVYVPQAWPESTKAYIMEEINVERPLVLPALDHPCATELAAWVRALRAEGILPLDVEAYEQPDGRVAVVNVDKFGAIQGADVVLPWGERRSVAEMTSDMPASWLY